MLYILKHFDIPILRYSAENVVQQRAVELLAE